MTKIKGGADTTKDLQSLEHEVDEATTEVAESIDFEGDGGAGGGGGDGVVARSCTPPPPPLKTCNNFE
jgi:hypothetical protein